MRFGLHALTLICWGLWIGGILTVFLIATTMFRVYDRPRAGDTNIVIFDTFQRFETGIAAITVLATAGQVMRKRTRPRLAVFTLICLAAVGVVASILIVTPLMQDLRAVGQSGSPQWARLHGTSMALFTAQAVLLLIAGIVLPGTWNDPMPVKDDASGKGD